MFFGSYYSKDDDDIDNEISQSNRNKCHVQAVSGINNSFALQLHCIALHFSQHLVRKTHQCTTQHTAFNFINYDYMMMMMMMILARPSVCQENRLFLSLHCSRYVRKNY